MRSHRLANIILQVSLQGLKRLLRIPKSLLTAGKLAIKAGLKGLWLFPSVQGTLEQSLRTLAVVGIYLWWHGLLFNLNCAVREPQEKKKDFHKYLIELFPVEISKHTWQLAIKNLFSILSGTQLNHGVDFGLMYTVTLRWEIWSDNGDMGFWAGNF